MKDLNLQIKFEDCEFNQEIPDISFLKAKGIIPTPIYNTYWTFAAKRQDIFVKRKSGAAFPWTNDSILLKYKFTNPYRASDRVSQYLIKSIRQATPRLE